ncbi:MAG: hypothetical protein Q4A00_06960 [Flavobacteriaceae bacterium]|nr:hypothetical protein [Flavobacteriaceae bacterium]
MVRFCYILSLFFVCHLYAQDLYSLKSSYVENQIHKNNKILSLTRDKNSWRWLSLLPNISISSHYDPFTQVYRPSINFSISLHNLSHYLQNNTRNRIEREKLALSLHQQLNNEISSIEAEILDIQRDSIALVYEEKNLDLLQQFNIIKSKQYEQNQINLEEKIRHELQLNDKLNAFNIRKLNYLNRREKLINKLKKQ